MNETLPPLTPGTLYLVATPIGNLEDITLRALRTLKECDVVAAEDTRRTGQLLKHFDISKPLLSYFQFNEARRSEQIIERLRRGEKVALVTDAGSPGISDPGERVVKAAIAAGLRVESVPGPTRAGGRADGQRIADRGVPLHRLPATQVRAAPPRTGAPQEHCRDARAVRVALPSRKAARGAERAVRRTPGGAGARADQEVRGVPAGHAGRTAGGPQGSAR